MTGDKNVAGQYCIAEPLDLLFAEAPGLALRPGAWKTRASPLSQGADEQVVSQRQRSRAANILIGVGAGHLRQRRYLSARDRSLSDLVGGTRPRSPRGPVDLAERRQGLGRPGQGEHKRGRSHRNRYRGRIRRAQARERGGAIAMPSCWRSTGIDRLESGGHVILRETQEFDNGTVTQDGIAQVFARRYEAGCATATIPARGSNGPARTGRRTRPHWHSSLPRAGARVHRGSQREAN